MTRSKQTKATTNALHYERWPQPSASLSLLAHNVEASYQELMMSLPGLVLSAHKYRKEIAALEERDNSDSPLPYKTQRVSLAAVIEKQNRQIKEWNEEWEIRLKPPADALAIVRLSEPNEQP